MNARQSLSCRICLLVALVTATASLAMAQPAAPPTKPPYDVLADRQSHYDALDRAREQALREYPLRYDADGNVIKDSAYEAALADYNRMKADSSERLRTNRRRDNELDVLRTQAGVPTDSKFDTGTPPHDSKYGGAFSDRDITVESTKHLNALVDSAKGRGYTVEHGGDYIRIKELDVVVWNPDKVTIRKTSSGETIVQRKPYSATAQVDRLSDAEVVLGHEKPGVSQQIKKAEADLRRPVPRSTREQHEMATNLGKAGYKAGKGVDADGSQGIVDAEQRRKLEALKGRQATVDDIADPFDKPEARRRKLNEFRGDVETVLRDTLKAERKQRTEELNRLKRETADLHRQLGETTDVAETTRLKNEIETRRQRTEAMRQQQQADDLTLRVVEKKNPRVRDQVIRPERPVADVDLPHTPKTGKLTVLKTYGMSMVGKGLGIHQAYETELSDAAREGRKFSQARMAVHMASNLSGVSGVIASVEGFEHETGQGLQDYVKSEVERYRAEGYDVSKMPGLQTVIHRRAILRATGRATWQAVKGVPLIGDLVSGIEDTYNLTESSVGLAYDAWKSRQIQQENRIEQKAQHEHTVALAEEMRDALRKQIALAEADAKLAEELATAQAKSTTFVEALETRIRETRTRLQETAKTATAPPSPVAANKLSEIEPYLQSVTKLAQGFVRDADALLKQFAADEVSPEDLAEQRGGFTRRMQAIDVDYLNATERLDTARSEAARLTAAGDLVSLRQALLLDLQTAQTTVATLDDLANRMDTLQKRSADIKRCFDDQKKRLQTLCEGPLYRLASDPIKETLRFIRAQALPLRLPQMAMEAHAVRTREMRLQRDRLRVFVEQVQAAMTELGAAGTATPTELETAAAWSRTLTAAEAMETAVAEARERMRRLRDASPSEPPAFDLATKALGQKTIQFEFTPLRLPPGKKKFVFNWDFGDGVVDASNDRVRKHEYARDGRYEASVIVWEETATLSKEIGKATVIVTIGSAAPTTPIVVKTLPPSKSKLPAIYLSASVKFDYDKQAKPILKDVGAGSSLSFRIEPDTGRVTVEMGRVFRSFYFEQPGGAGYPYYRVEIDGWQNETQLDPRSNRIELPIPDITWRQEVSVWSLGGGVKQNKYTLADGHRRCGIDPSSLRWAGVLTGELDWRSGRTGATRGRFEINKLHSGDWEIEARDFLAIAVPEEVRRVPGKSMTQRTQLMLYPNEGVARVKMPKTGTHRLQLPHDPDHDVAPFGRGFSTRIGRWVALWERPEPPILGSIPGHEQQYKQLVKYVEQIREPMEKLFPASGL